MFQIFSKPKCINNITSRLRWCLCTAAIISGIGLTLQGCTKFVVSDPPTEFISDLNVFSIDATAISAVSGLYVTFNASNQPFQGAGASIGLITGLSSDEFALYNPVATSSYINYYNNNHIQLPNTAGSGHQTWIDLFNMIMRCNAAIEGLNAAAADGLTPAVKKQLLGEVTFLRAFCNYYIVNLYGDAPICLNTAPLKNNLLGRSPVSEVYKQITTDLLSAQGNLSKDFLNASLNGVTTERIRPTYWAATALLARVYLSTGQPDKAAENSTLVISNALFGPIGTVTLNNVFLKNSKEAIWQIQPTDIGFNTLEGKTYLLPSTGPNTNSNPVSLSNILFNSFEAGDQRAKPKNWIDTITVAGTFYRFPYKYKQNVVSDPTITTATGTANMKEYYMVLRLAEQYLIRAEAKAILGDVSGAQADLNAVRNRAGLGNTTANSSSTLVTAILRERQVELFSEWGHRWFDLKRSGTINSVMSTVTPIKSAGLTSWQPFQALFPIPYDDIKADPNLVQNPGY